MPSTIARLKSPLKIGFAAALTLCCILPCDGAAETSRNILLVICDQEQNQLLPVANYALPARQELMKRGVVFRNHYTAAAMGSPARAAILTGLPPQRNGVFDEMVYPYVPALDPAIPTMGSVLKKLGYTTAYFGRFDMSRDFLAPDAAVNYSAALRPYGFDHFSPAGDSGGTPNSGYKNDVLTAGQAVQWLRTHGVSQPGKPFFLVAGFVNPHDITYADANLPGESVQQSPVQHELTAPPDNAIYRASWEFELPRSLTVPLDGAGMPSALAEYQKGWTDALGDIPTGRPEMWKNFYNYYLNMLRDSDTQLQAIVDALNELDLWKNTIVVFVSSHGEMGGSHGGLRGKGPFAYEENANVAMTVVHPDFLPGTSDAVTSHLDLLPTLVSFSGAPAEQCKELLGRLPGRDLAPALDPATRTDPHAVREGALFNYVAPLTVDAGFCTAGVGAGSGPAAKSKINLADLKPHLGKRGFVAFAFDGRHKLARFYAPDNFRTPSNVDELLAGNDVQLFDLQEDPDETNNLALDREKNGELLARMNTLLNDLMAREVGKNDGAFLPAVIRPKGVAPLKVPPK